MFPVLLVNWGAAIALFRLDGGAMFMS
jgi:hypothetical protein